MIKFFFVMFLSLPLFAGSLSLYDLAFLVSKSSGKSVIFSKEVNQKIKIIVADTPVNYLPLFKQSLISNGYQLKTDKTFFYVTVPNVEKKSEGAFSSISNLGFSSPSSSTLQAPPPLVSANDGNSISVMSNGSKIYSSPMISPSSHRDSLSDLNNSDLAIIEDLNISFKTLSLVYLNPADINTTLDFSGFKYSFSSNSKSIVFAVPEKKLGSFDSFSNTLKSLDVPRDQVTLKITVFDSNQNKLRDLGLSPLFNLDTNLSSASGALFTGSLVASFYSSLHLLETKGVTSVTDTPTFLLSDNQTLNFKSVLNIPFLDSNVNVTSQASTNQTNAFKYKDVGFKVVVTPTIVNDIVYLDFSISFENVVIGGDHPTTAEKSIKNKFSLHKGDLIVLAGISKDTLKNTNDSIPFINQIPYLGKFLTHDYNSKLNESFNISIEVVK